MASSSSSSKGYDFEALAARLESQGFSSLSSLSPLELRLLGSSSRMTWNEKKALENERVVALGGKPPKKQRLPLSASKIRMKNQKKREEKAIQEGMVLERFGGRKTNSNRRPDKRKAEDRVLKATEGRFKNGVLDVKDLLRSTPAREISRRPLGFGSFGGEQKKKAGTGKKKGGRKHGGKKRR